MHEHKICKSIVEEALKYGLVKAITVEVGELAHPPIQELEEYLAAITTWKIIMKNKKATINCECGFMGAPNILEQNHTNVIYNCPQCKALLPEVVDGDKVILRDVEVK